MDIKLTDYYVIAQNAEKEVQRVMAEMSNLIALGTKDGDQAALNMRPVLALAQEKAAAAMKTYVLLRDGNFVKDNSGYKEITRAVFDGLTPADRMAFIKSGGMVVD